MTPWSRLSLFLALALLPATLRSEGDDVSDILSQRIRSTEKFRGKVVKQLDYFLIGPKHTWKDGKLEAPEPKKGYSLLVVLPGGDGGADFNPFVKRIYKHALGPEWMAAQLVAPKWERSKQIVWPTRKTPGRGVTPSTEESVETVITDVAARKKLDPNRIFLLAWSSGGPAAYAVSLEKYKSITGLYIAMSVFKPSQLPPLREAAREAYLIEHSPEDSVCPFSMAEDAAKRLKSAGARVKLVSYEGGHGWHGNVYGRIREGVAWLEKNHARPSKKVWVERLQDVKKKRR
jgi:predicted esterase